MAYFGGTTSERPWPIIDVRTVLLLVISLAGLSISFYLVKDNFFALMPREKPVAAAVPALAPAQAAVFVVKQEVAQGRLLSAEMFAIEQRPVASLGNTVIQNLNEIEGKYAKVSLKPGVVLSSDFLMSERRTADIIQRIPEGYRAVAIPVNVVTGVEGWVQPGARVDVVWATTHRGRHLVTTIVENAQVLSAERSLEAQPGPGAEGKPVPNHITLLVSTKDAQKIQLAKGSGSLSLSLRGEEDMNRTGSETLSTDSLLGNRDDMRNLLQGRVMFDGKEFVMRGGKLVSAEEDARLNPEQPNY